MEGAAAPGRAASVQGAVGRERGPCAAAASATTARVSSPCVVANAAAPPRISQTPCHHIALRPVVVGTTGCAMAACPERTGGRKSANEGTRLASGGTAVTREGSSHGTAAFRAQNYASSIHSHGRYSEGPCRCRKRGRLAGKGSMGLRQQRRNPAGQRGESLSIAFSC